MANKRGAANLARYNTERSANVLPLLINELQLCRKRKVEFKTIGLLAAYLSDRVPAVRTTLLRNVKYRSLLLAHLGVRPGAVLSAPDTTEDPAILQAKLAVAKLDASQSREDLREKSAQIKRLEKLGAFTGSEVDFADLAMVMAALLVRFADFLELDINKRELIDRSAKPSDRFVAGPDRIGKFCAWLVLNKALPQVQLLNGPPSQSG